MLPGETVRGRRVDVCDNTQYEIEGFRARYVCVVRAEANACSALNRRATEEDEDAEEGAAHVWRTSGWEGGEEKERMGAVRLVLFTIQAEIWVD